MSLCLRIGTMTTFLIDPLLSERFARMISHWSLICLNECNKHNRPNITNIPFSFRFNPVWLVQEGLLRNLLSSNSSSTFTFSHYQMKFIKSLSMYKQTNGETKWAYCEAKGCCCLHGQNFIEAREAPPVVSSLALFVSLCQRTVLLPVARGNIEYKY